ncbi:UbiA family prenyltransferase [Acidipila sp. EB88]|nr:UbiA family prenyltransferase [Acidipila sp. EB88]RRA50063.1 UbiA family prenyltransferase [Acidipila sp. EB88]
MIQASTPIQSAAAKVEASRATARPLCVDLDGTLVKCDTLIDTLLLMVRTHTRDLALVPGWIARGKATLKREVTARIRLDVATLPYNQPLLQYLELERGRGRRLYLATGADSALADRVAKYLGLFDGVLASDGRTNLTGHNKLRSFEERFGAGGFDYIGNARPDVPLLCHAGTAMTANPDAALRRAIRAGKFVAARQFIDRVSPLRALQRAARVHQWAKNVLMFVPLLLAHALQPQRLFEAVLAFVCFSLCASSTYIVNDLLDIEADRKHPRKRRRPFAAGDLQAKTGVLLSAGLLVAALGLAAFLPGRFMLCLVAYLVTTLSYSLYLKRVVLVDVVLLSGLYTLRLLAGSAATGVAISPWLAGFSVFLFLSLAIVKRFAELQNIRAAGQVPSNGRGYLLSDIEQMRSFGTSSAYASIVVFSLYISQGDVAGLYPHPQRLWLMTPIMILWVSRVWLLASRGELDEDPVIFALTDRMSLLLGATAVCVLLVAAIH